MPREDEQGLITPAVISPTRMLEGRMPSLALHPRYAADCSDVRPDSGILKKRTGFNAFSVAISAEVNLDGYIQGLCQTPFGWEDDIVILLQDGSNSTYYVYDTSTTYWVEAKQQSNEEYSQLSWCPGVTSAAVEVVVLSDNKIPIQTWVTAGTVAPISFDSGHTIKAQVVRYFYDRLCMFNVDEETVGRDKKMVKWTGVGDITDDDGGSAESNLILGRKGGQIVGAETLADDMIIYCEHEIIRMAHIGGTTVFRFDPMDVFNGLVAQKAIANLGDRHLFLSDKYSVQEYTGGRFCRPIGDPINASIRSNINKDEASKSFFVVARGLNEAWLFIPTGDSTYCDTVYVIRFGGCVEEYSWYKYSMNAFAAMEYDNWNVLAGYDDAICDYDYKATTLSDGGSAIDGWYQTIDFTNVENPSQRLRHEGMNVETKGTADGELVVQYSANEGTGWSAAGIITLTAAWAVHELKFDTGYQRKIRYRFGNNTSTATFELKWFQPIMLPGGER